MNSGKDLTVRNNMVRLGLDTAGNAITSGFEFKGIYDVSTTANYYHNSVYIGPSGSLEPSRADEHLTQALKSALALVDVRVLDHVVVGASGHRSMAERGLI